MNSRLNAETCELSQDEYLYRAKNGGQIYRLTRGILVFDQAGKDHDNPVVQMAMPGDLVGLETLCHRPYASSARALMSVRAMPLMFDQDYMPQSIVHEACQQLQRQSNDMVRLRTGSIRQRLAYFLKLYANARSTRSDELDRRDLPALKFLAEIVDSRVETVCRELNALLPGQGARSKPTADQRAAKRPTTAAMRSPNLRAVSTSPVGILSAPASEGP